MLLAVGRWLKAVARHKGLAVVATTFSRSPATVLSGGASTQTKPERQPLGPAWENVPHCRILLSRVHAVDGQVHPRAARILSTTLAHNEVAGQAVHVKVTKRGVVDA